MFEAFRVGPVETSDGNFILYAACGPAGAVSAIAADDRAGLAELRRSAPSGSATCEPGLAAAGSQLGFRAAALSDEAKETRATFATMLYLGQSVEPWIVGQIPQAIEVAQQFLRARPWQLVRPEVPVELTLAIRDRERRLVASVMGADGFEHGLALHESAEAHARFVELAERDRPDEMRKMAFTSLTIDPEPAWVADAVKEACGDPLVVVPLAMGARGPRTVTSEELGVLIAAMFAVSKLAPGRLTADATVEIEGGPCRATARVGERDAASATRLPAWTAERTRWTGPVPAVVLAVPILPVDDLTAAAAGLRALGFHVAVSDDHPGASARWPGLAIELVEVPSSNSGCHVVVEEIDSLVAAWKRIGVDVRVREHGSECVACVEVPGGLSLSFGTRLPAGCQPPGKPRRRAPRRRPS